MSSREKPNSLQEKLETAVQTGHRMIGRRAFLGQGLIAGVGTVLMPSLLSLIARPAFGNELQSCQAGNNAASRVPFLNIDLAGGANLVGANFLVGGRDGQLDFSSLDYRKMGQVKPEASEAVTEFGIAFHPQSPILQGLREATAPALRSKIDGCLFAAESIDDSIQNQQNPSHWIVKSGTRGALVPQVGFRTGSAAGHQPFPAASILASSLPVQVRNDADARSLAQLSQIQKAIGEKGTRRVLEAVSRMSEAQLARFNQKEFPDQIRAMVDCGYLKSSDDLFRFQADKLSSGNFFDTLKDNVSETAVLAHAAGVSKLVLEGFAGAGTIELAGRDYHGQARSVTNKMDRELGQILGRCFTAAARLGKNLMVHLMSDGAVSGEGPDYPWCCDNQAFSASVLLVYRHDAASASNGILRDTRKRQVGAYTSEGIDFKNPTLITDNKNNKASMARCVVANYLALHGEEGNLKNIIGDSEFDASLNDYVVFNKIA